MTTNRTDFRIFRTTFVLILFALISASSPAAFSADQGKVKPYPLDYCILDGKPLGEHPTSFVYKGQEIKVDDQACKEVFMQDPDTWLKKVHEAAKKHKKAPAQS